MKTLAVGATYKNKTIIEFLGGCVNHEVIIVHKTQNKETHAAFHLLRYVVTELLMF